MIHAATDVDTAKLTAATRRTITSADLKKMLKDVICSDNHFPMTEPDDGRFLLPRLAHYDSPLEPIHIAVWLRDIIGMTPFMAHAYFRPFLHQAFEASPDDHHQEFSANHLYPSESVAPPPNNSLADYLEDHDWTPNRGPCGCFFPSPETSTTDAITNTPLAPAEDMTPASMSTTSAPANAPPALSDDSNDNPDSHDTVMIDSGAAATNATSTAPQSTVT